MEYVSEHYQQTLDNLSESLRAQRREKLTQVVTSLALDDTQPIPIVDPVIDRGRC